MKKIIYVVFCMAITNVMWSQDLRVAASGAITVLPGSLVFAGNSNVEATGTLTVTSDATKSGSLIVAGTSTGNITYKRHIDDTDWHLVSAPVTAGTIPAFVAGTGNDIATGTADANNYAVAYYKNDNAAGFRWTYHNTVNTAVNQETLGNFDTGLGYIMKKSVIGDYIFTGPLAIADGSGNVAVTIPFEAPTTYAHTWAAVGNPYPSFLPANNAANTTNILSQNTTILDPSYAALYIWDGSAYQPRTINAAALQLAPGQAFIVKADPNNAPGAQFKFSKASQNYQSVAVPFFKAGNTTPSIVVSLTNGSQNNTTTVEFLDTATTGLDVGYDAGTYQDGTAAFSVDTHLVLDSEGINFAIQSLPNSGLDSNLAIPLSVRAAANQEVSFGVSTSNLPQDLNVYIEDTENNTYTDITAAAYKTNVDKALNGVGRFYLHTSSKTLSAEDAPLTSSLSVYKTAGNILKIVGLNAQSNTTVKMYTVTGKQILTNQFVAADRIKDILLPASLSAGVYIVNIVSENGVFSKKLILE